MEALKQVKEIKKFQEKIDEFELIVSKMQQSSSKVDAMNLDQSELRELINKKCHSMAADIKNNNDRCQQIEDT